MSKGIFRDIDFCFKSQRVITVSGVNVGPAIEDEEKFFSDLFSDNSEYWISSGPDAPTIAVNKRQLESVVLRKAKASN